jgi:hypothetical protein
MLVAGEWRFVGSDAAAAIRMELLSHGNRNKGTVEKTNVVGALVVYPKVKAPEINSKKLVTIK